MGNGIAIIGLNGSGKSTLGHALAKELGYYEIDVEDYYFPEQMESRSAALDGKYDIECSYLGDIPYSEARGKREVEQALATDISNHQNYVLCGVTLNWDEKIISSIQKVFWLKVNSEERVKRVKDREERRWEERVLEGGNMYEQQCSFRNLIGGLTEQKVADSIKNIKCEVVVLDGLLPVSSNVEIIKEKIGYIF